MVSLWPWRGSDNSPASFEKTLSALSVKIARTNSRLAQHVQRSRRFKALWTLYTTFAYILYILIATLVLGRDRWGQVEYTVLSGSPVLIYIVRRIGGSFFKYRISITQKNLDQLQKERDKTIEKLKEATKYNSTLQLLEKYGSPAPDQHPDNAQEDAQYQNPKRRSPRDRMSLPAQSGRTTMPPPPTANIPRTHAGSVPPTPFGQHSPQIRPSVPAVIAPPQREQQEPNEPGFHPSAFAAPQYSVPRAPQWYDRLMDVLLGEDETLAKNRLALICSRCRLVNGQAAPGVQTIEDVGRWRCGGCGAWNGEADKTSKPALGGGQQRERRSERPRSRSISHTPLSEELSPAECASNLDTDPESSEVELESGVQSSGSEHANDDI
ncbi:hypothetical protein FQN57_001097 [Myotisia sp. PD_48]|nr:hypothetical protein FQN57_001097 [Myotisia sp. PD_48]